MKFFISFLALCCFLPSYVNGQVGNITYNVTSQTLTVDVSVEKIKLGETYKVVVNGVDLNLYKVIINNVDSVTQKAIAFPGFGTFDITTLATLVKDIGASGGINAVLSSLYDSSKVVNAINDPQFKIDMKVFSSHKSGTLQKNLLAPPLRADVEIGLFEAYIDKQYELLLVQKDSIDALKLDAGKVAMSYLIKDKNSQSYLKLSGNKPVISDILDNSKTLRDNLNRINWDLVKEYNTYSQNLRSLRSVILRDRDLIKRDSLARKAYAEFSKVLEKGKASLSDSIVLGMVKPLIVFENNNSSTYSSLPLQFSKDETTLTLEIKPLRDDNYLPAYKTTYTFPTTKRSYVALSSGIFVSTLHNKAFSTKTTVSATDTTYSLSGEQPGKFEFGSNVMLRFGVAIKDNVSWQFGFGPGVTVTNKIKPRALIGTGAAFGYKHKFLIDFGLSMGYVDVLSNVYDETTVYSTQPADVMVSRFKAGAYMSLGYMFNL
ncbi:hypothetical protein [Desertivirga xinjiangensis]|uniref:hypothetical protein n=1 Tax=Desertivirga xinjiangensis TaxID=539206 RepID=UPI00210EE850|nr:hypothetical protein [Pedobacter xinjiangensis]